MAEIDGSWERVASIASDAFLRRGFAAVSLRAIADALGMKPASLYFHCPGGKAELYVRSLAFAFESYRAGLEAAANNVPFARAVLAMSNWMLSQPPVDMRRIAGDDQTAVAKSSATLAADIPMLLHAAIFEPFYSVFVSAVNAGEVRSDVDPAVAAASVIAITEGLGGFHAHAADSSSENANIQFVRDALRLLLRGAGAALED